MYRVRRCAVGVLFFLICKVIAQNDMTQVNNNTKNSTSAADQVKYAKYTANPGMSSTAGLPETGSSRKIINEIISNKCSHKYSVLCLKIDLSRLIDKLGRTKNFQILPGISLVNTDNSTLTKSDLLEDVAVSFVRSNDNSSELNSYLLRKIGKYFSSLSVRVNLLDNPLIQNLKYLTYNAFNSFFNPLQETGRGKKGGKGDQHAAMWSAAMLAALGFSGLAALAGKAMLTGALALVLSLVCLLKGCGGGHKAAHYEIITKPAHMHDVEHIGLSGSLGSSPYGSYARHLIQDRVIPALNILDTDSSDEKELVREVIPVHSYPIPPNYGPSSMIHR